MSLISNSTKGFPVVVFYQQHYYCVLFPIGNSNCVNLKLEKFDVALAGKEFEVKIKWKSLNRFSVQH